LEPDSARFLSELGSAHASLGDYNKALECYEAASRSTLATLPDQAVALKGEAE